MINVYINESLWSFFDPEDKIPIFLFFGDMFRSEKIGLVSKMKFGEGEIFEDYKKITIFLETKLKERLRKEKGIEYSLYTENCSYGSYVLFDSSDLRESFSDPNKNIECYYFTKLDMFAEFCFYPNIWTIRNHHKWPTSFREDVFLLLLVLKRLRIHKDLKYPIIRALSIYLNPKS